MGLRRSCDLHKQKQLMPGLALHYAKSVCARPQPACRMPCNAAVLESHIDTGRALAMGSCRRAALPCN
jgi:hypothetical protein